MSPRRRQIRLLVLAAGMTYSACGVAPLAYARAGAEPPPTDALAKDSSEPDAAPTEVPSSAASSTLAPARELFRQGSALAEGEHWAAARKAYEASFALFPHATTLYNIGYCQWQQGELSAAWYATTRAIEGTEFPVDRRLSDARRAVATQQQAALRARLAVVRLLTVVPNLQVRVDGEPLVNPGSNPLGPFVPSAAGATPAQPVLAAGAELLLNPGAHQVQLEVALARQTHSLQLAPGESTSLAWQQPDSPPKVVATAKRTNQDHTVPAAASQARAPSSAAALRTYGTIAAWSVAGLGFTTAAVAGGLAIGARASLDKQCADHQCPPSASGDVARYETSIRWVNAGLIVGGLGAIAGVVLKVTAAPRKVSSNTSLLITPSGVALVRQF